jgi:hypothetical protein
MIKAIVNIDSSINLLVNLWVWVVLSILPYRFYRGKYVGLIEESQSDIFTMFDILPYNLTTLLEI